MSNRFSSIFKFFILAPIISRSDKSNNTSNYFLFCGFIIVIIDAMLYGISLYLSIPMINEVYDQSITKQSNSQQAIDALVATQTDLYDLIKDLIHNSTSDKLLLENSLNKLTTLELIHKDNIMTIQKNSNQLVLLDFCLLNRISFYICTYSFILFIQQIVLWFIQYLTLKNSEKYLTYLFILSAIILNQSLAFIYFLQITNIFSFPSPLFVYMCIYFIRNLLSTYHYTFSDDSF